MYVFVYFLYLYVWEEASVTTEKHEGVKQINDNKINNLLFETIFHIWNLVGTFSCYWQKCWWWRNFSECFETETKRMQKKILWWEPVSIVNNTRVWHDPVSSCTPITKKLYIKTWKWFRKVSKNSVLRSGWFLIV